MAGRSLTKARYEADQLRILEARSTPTEPRTQPIDYTPDLCSEIMELTTIGLAQAEIAAHWCISEETLKGWEEAHLDFKAAAQRARTRAKAWWQRQPRLAIAEQNNKFPAGAWAQQVRALFPEYDDKAPSIVIDLSGLVVVSRRAPELPSEQTAAGRNQLIEQQPVRLTASPTASDEVEIRPDQAVRPGEREGG